MKILRTALLLALVASVAACSKLTEDNLQKIKPGMTTADVKAILGDPTDSQVKSIPILGSSTVFTYHTGTSNVVVTFVNDKVVTTDGSFQ